jgi:Tol biopolymer transport system component
MQVDPDGTKNVPVITGLPISINALAANPNVKGQYALAVTNSTSGLVGIYLATVSSAAVISSQQTLVSPVYSNNGGVSQLAFTQDGSKVVYTAANSAGTESDLYYVSVAGGVQTPAPLDTNVYQVAVGQDSNTLVYTKAPNNGDTQLFLGTISSGDSNAKQITTDAAYHDYPQFSRDGKSIVYSSLPDADQSSNGGSGNYHIATLNFVTSGATPVDLPKLSGVSLTGPSYSSDDSEISVCGVGSNAATGIYTQASSGKAAADLILQSSSLEASLLRDSTYWTTTNGRASGGGAAGWSLSLRSNKLHP